jgi:hypothetical protein
MKSFLLAFILFLSSAVTTAQDSTALIVGPGTIHHHVTKQAGPYNLNILEVDISNPFISVETVLAKDVLGTGFERTSSMSQRSTSTGHTVLGAINGDYFGISDPTNPYTFLGNSMIADGEYVFARTTNRSLFGIDDSKTPLIDILNFIGEVSKENEKISIIGVNRERGENQLILYNKFFGASTKTNSFGTEIKIEPIDELSINSDLKFEVIAKEAGVGSLAIDGMYVLSGHGTTQSFLGNVLEGDTITLRLGTSPNLGKITGLIGGGPRLINNGVRPSNFDGLEGFGTSHVNSKHPRTAIGFSEDSTKLFLLVVDGRQSFSVGMTCAELADYMLSIGCYHAVNLDGGGSSTIVVRNQIANSSSDGSERSVGNAILIVSSAPTGSIHKLHVSPSYVRIFSGKTQQFTVQATDEYNNPVFVNNALLNYSLSNPNLGSVSNSGLFTAGTIADSGYLVVSYGELKDSVFIVVKTISSLEIFPKRAVTDLSRLITFSAKVFDTDYEEQQVQSNQIAWSVSDPSVGSIDAVGQFKGVSEGEVKVAASYLNLVSDTAIVTIQLGYGFTTLDSVETIDSWEFGSENIDSTSTFFTLSSEQSSLGEKSIKIDYSFQYQPGLVPWVYLYSEKHIYGVPDSLYIDFFSDGLNHRIFFDVVDAAGFPYRIITHKIANKAGEFEAIRGRIPSSTSVIFPLTLKRIAVVLGSTQIAGEIYTGTVYIDNLKVKYPQMPTSAEREFENINGFKLYQNYPNPFNSSTKIKFSIPSSVSPLLGGARGGYVTLKVFDVLGSEIVILVNEEKTPGSYEVMWDASNVSTGVYVYVLEAAAVESNKYYRQSRKMTVLK